MSLGEICGFYRVYQSLSLIFHNKYWSLRSKKMRMEYKKFNMNSSNSLNNPLITLITIFIITLDNAYRIYFNLRLQKNIWKSRDIKSIQIRFFFICLGFFFSLFFSSLFQSPCLFFSLLLSSSISSSIGRFPSVFFSYFMFCFITHSLFSLSDK